MGEESTVPDRRRKAGQHGCTGLLQPALVAQKQNTKITWPVVLVFLLSTVTILPCLSPSLSLQGVEIWEKWAGLGNQHWPSAFPLSKHLPLPWFACVGCRAVHGSLLPSPWERGGRTWRQPASLQSTPRWCSCAEGSTSFSKGRWEEWRHCADPLSMTGGLSLHLFNSCFPRNAGFNYERGNLTLIPTSVSSLKTKYLQTLLKGKALWDLHLPASNWTVEDVARFLSNSPEDFETENGSVYTWVDAFNETDRAIQTISRFMEVRSCYCGQGIWGRAAAWSPLVHLGVLEREDRRSSVHFLDTTRH